MAEWIVFWRSVMCFVVFTGVSSNLNLYISDAEVKNLLGLNAQLYYVRNGKVNDHAVRFNLPIPSDVGYLNFTWYTTTETQVFYSMDLISENSSILRHPIVNISQDGEVPRIETVFQIVLFCTGLAEAEVGLFFQFNLTLHSYSAKNITTLNFKRRKMCPIDEKYKGREQLVTDTTTKGEIILSNSSVAISNQLHPRAVTSTSVFYIAVGVVCGVIFLIAMIVAFVHVQSMKPSDRVSENGSSVHLPHHPVNPYNKVDNKTNNLNGRVYNDMNRFYPAKELTTDEFKTKLKNIAIERSQITLGDILQEGTFGRIYHGYVVTSTKDSESQHEEEIEVFIKTVTDQASEEQRSLLIKESCMLHELNHRSILPIMYVCLEDEKQPLILLAHMQYGNLKHFLKNGRISDAHQGLSTRDLVYMGIQITRGMQYLGKQKIVHRDLATRNCVIDEDYNVKITDNALARDLFPQDYTCLGDNENRPVKWLAIESLIEKKYLPTSDVWSFGVTLWELMTLGQTPYADVDPFEMAAYLKNGYRMAQPANCPDELFSVMACCWALSPGDRPTFAHLLSILMDFHRALGIYI